MAYICAKYAHPNELSNARLTKTIYLADWRSAILRGKQITEVEWEFSHYGPFVHDVMNVARSDPAFEVVQTTNAYGSDSALIKLSEWGGLYSSLTDEDKRILDDVMEITQPKYWSDFMRLVYSTYPILTQPRYSTLDLPTLAQEYKANPVLAAE